MGDEEYTVPNSIDRLQHPQLTQSEIENNFLIYDKNGKIVMSMSPKAVERFNEPISREALEELGFTLEYLTKYLSPDGEFRIEVSGNEWDIIIIAHGDESIIKSCKTLGQVNNWYFGLCDRFLF